MRTTVQPDAAAITAAIAAVQHHAGGDDRVEVSWHVESASGPGWDDGGTAPVDVVIDAIGKARELEWTSDGLVIVAGAALFTVRGVTPTTAGE